MSALLANKTSSVKGNFVWLRADGLSLVLPQHDVGEAQHLGEPLVATQAPGLLRRSSDASGRHFAALSSRMGLLAQCPPDRFVIASLASGKDAIAWCWNELKVLIGVELHPRPLPAVLVAPGTPVTAYVELAGEFAFVCDAKRLQAFALGERAA